jgi:hypothetical protein
MGMGLFKGLFIVAFIAQKALVTGNLKQKRIPRTMRIMAGKTLPSLNRLMNHLSFPVGIVTLLTQGRPFRNQDKLGARHAGMLAFFLLMASLALGLFYRLMHIILRGHARVAVSCKTVPGRSLNPKAQKKQSEEQADNPGQRRGVRQLQY